MDAGEHLDEGRFAGAVAAQQGVDLARADVEIDLIDGDGPAEGLGDRLHGDDRAHAFPQFPPARCCGPGGL